MEAGKIMWYWRNIGVQLMVLDAQYVHPAIGDVAPREQDLDRDDGAEFDVVVRDSEDIEVDEQDDFDFDMRDDFDHEDRFADLDPSPYDGTYSEE
jgi:uncharacterized protein YijF (DUF1287 family)